MEPNSTFLHESDSSECLTDTDSETEYQVEVTQISTPESTSNDELKEPTEVVSGPSVESFLSDHAEEHVEITFKRDYTAENYSVFVVDSPRQTGNLLKSKVTYRIHCVTTVDSYPSSEITVRRSFRDTKWLRYHLKQMYPHCIIPPLINNKTISQTEKSTSLIAFRQRAIQRFLNRIGAHVKLSHSKVLHLFLTGDGKNFKEIKHHQNKIIKSKQKRISVGGFRLFSSSSGPASSDETFKKMKMFRKEVNELIESHRNLHHTAHELAVNRKSTASNLKLFSKQLAKFNTSTELRYPSSKIDTSSLVNTLITFQTSLESLKVHEKLLAEYTFDTLYELIKDWAAYLREAIVMTERYERSVENMNDTQTSITHVTKKLQHLAEERRVSHTQKWLDSEDHTDEIQSHSKEPEPLPESEELTNLEKQLKKDKKKVERFVSNFTAEQISFDTLRSNEMKTWTRYFAELSLIVYRKMASECERYIASLDK